MKVKQTVLNQIIKEETLKIQKLINLQEQRKILITQINEVYENDDEIEEGFLGLGKKELSQKTFDKKKNEIMAKLNKVLNSPVAKRKGLSMPEWATNPESLAYATLAAIALNVDAVVIKDGQYLAPYSMKTTGGHSTTDSHGMSVDDIRVKFPNYAMFTGEATV